MTLDDILCTNEKFFKNCCKSALNKYIKKMNEKEKEPEDFIVVFYDRQNPQKPYSEEESTIRVPLKLSSGKRIELLFNIKGFDDVTNRKNPDDDRFYNGFVIYGPIKDTERFLRQGYMDMGKTYEEFS